MPFMAAIPAIAAGAGLLGRLFGGAAKGSSDQRMSENNQRLIQTQANNADALARASLMSNNANTRASMQNTDNQFRAGLDLQRRQFAQQEPSAQAKQAMVGSLLQRLQPMRAPSGFAQRPSIIDALGPDARQAGALLSQRGLSGLQSGPTKFTDMPAVSLPQELNLPPAQIAALQKSGLLEKLLGGAGLVGSIMGGLGEFGNLQRPTSGNGLPVDEIGGG